MPTEKAIHRLSVGCFFVLSCECAVIIENFLIDLVMNLPPTNTLRRSCRRVFVCKQALFFPQQSIHRVHGNAVELPIGQLPCGEHHQFFLPARLVVGGRMAGGNGLVD